MPLNPRILRTKRLVLSEM